MRSSGISGQAVVGGVMMRNHGRYAVAVRKPDGEIAVQKEKIRTLMDRFFLLRLPLIRGIAVFFEALFLGMKTLSYSVNLLEEEEEAQEEEYFVGYALIVVLAVLFSILFFLVLPFGLSELLATRIQSVSTLAWIEAGLRILLFLGFVFLISLVGDIKKLAGYHGAEHQVINCIEKGLVLTPANVKKQSYFFKRCKTDYLLEVVFVSVILFLFIHIENIPLRMLYRILVFPATAAVLYEWFRFLNHFDNGLTRALQAPRALFQRMVVRKPEPGMAEVAIAATEAVFDWRKYQDALRKQSRKKQQKKQSGEPVAAAERKGSGEEEANGSEVSVSLLKERGRKQQMEPENGENTESPKKDKAEPDAPKHRSVRDRRGKKDQGGFFSIFARKGSREKVKELEDREEGYRKRAKERVRRMKELEQREAAHEETYQAAKKRLDATRDLPKVSRGMKPAPQLDINGEKDDLDALDRFFDKGDGE